MMSRDVFLSLFASVLLVGCGSSEASSGTGEGSVRSHGQEQQMTNEPIPEVSNIDDLQVQPPQPIDYKPARPGEIRIKPESVFCSAQYIVGSLRSELRLPDELGLVGSIQAALYKHAEALGLSKLRTSDGRRRGYGVNDRSNQLQRELYGSDCSWAPETIYIDVVASLNVTDEPYRVEVSIRQNDKEWKHVVERSASTLPEESKEWFNGEDGGYMSLTDKFQVSMQYDMRRIGREVEEFLLNGR